jgi:hypothetical protein
MRIQNRKGEPLISIYNGNEVYRITRRGKVNLGRTFNHFQIEQLKAFVRSADHYVTWIEFKKFLRSI